MVTTPSPAQNQQSKAEAYAEKLSDRTRTSCLGALVIVWAILGEKKTDAAINVSKWAKVALLAVGVGAIVVLALDFLESAFGYIRSRQAAGDSGVTPTSYEHWEDHMRFGKLVLGPTTLIALCLVLGIILCASLNAQTERSPNETHFIGTWCGAAVDSGGNRINGSYRCATVRVLRPENNMAVTIGYPDGEQMNWIECTSYTFADPVIYAFCPGDADIELAPTKSDEVIDYIRGQPEQDQYLRIIR